MDNIALNLERIKQDIKTHQQNTRPLKPLRLIVVTKTFDMSFINPLVKAGHNDFGENRVQEAKDKWQNYDRKGADLHLIGALQSNKIKQAMQLADYIHSLDSIKMAEKIAKLRDETKKCPKLLMQVNSGEEPQKAGILPDDAAKLVDQVKALGLPLEGFMVIPPVDDLPAPHFAMIAQMAKEHQLTELSMGMSKDWREAVTLGATFLRIGSLIMGNRSNKANL